MEDRILYLRQSNSVDKDKRGELENKFLVLFYVIGYKTELLLQDINLGSEQAKYQLEKLRPFFGYFRYPRKTATSQQIRTIIDILSDGIVEVKSIKDEHLVNYLYQIAVGIMKSCDKEFYNDVKILAENIYKNNTLGFIDVPIKKSIKKKLNGSNLIARSEKIRNNALDIAQHMCEIDTNHIHFNSRKTGLNYVEGHHLIPLKYQDDQLINYSLDTEANIISLCVVCHKKLHYANFEDKKLLLDQLYGDRKQRLSECGIQIPIEILYQYYINEIEV